MNLPLDRVYRKTARGQAAVNTRSAELPARGRTALILVNGREPFGVLEKKIGADAQALIELLLGLGFVEELPAATSARPATKPAAPAAPPPAAPNAAEIAAVQVRLLPFKREAVARLAPQFGPDVDLVCRPLIESASDAAYHAALTAIEAKLAIYLGRSAAKRMLDGLWP